MRASKIRYLLFDLNGTLVTENYLKHTEVFENILNYERRGEGLTVEKLRDVSKGKTSLKELVAKNYVVDDPEVASYRFLEVQVSQISLKKKTLDILEALHQKYTLILCSDTTGIAKEVVKKFKLSNYFDKIFYSCDVGYLKSEKNDWEQTPQVRVSVLDPGGTDQVKRSESAWPLERTQYEKLFLDAAHGILSPNPIST